MLEDCWICELSMGTKKEHRELRKSRDHVVPKKFGGGYTDGNIKWAHMFCNNARGCSPVSDGMRRAFRAYMLQNHQGFFYRKHKEIKPLSEFSTKMQEALS